MEAINPKHKAVELKMQFGDNAKYVALEIMDVIKHISLRGDATYGSMLCYFEQVKSELEKS